MAISYEQFADRLISSGLLTADEVREAAEKLPPEQRGRDAQTLARELITAGKLTKHQATALYLGETKGLVLGNYVILDKLGEGGMGEVYRARHKVMEREVALKVLPKAMVTSPDAIKRFQREVRAAAKLEHQNIVIAYDADQAGGRHFLVMQFVDGRDLSGIVKQNGPMTIEQAIDCCSQAARGLAYAHSKGVIHRDIKPSNLLLDKTGTVKILDMGLARLAGQADEGSALGGLTQSGQIMGTVDYMAPEQAEDTREADHRADIYSLGCTLYVLLTAKAPFTGQTVLQKMMAHQQKPIPKLSDARGDTPPKLDAVLAKMLAKRPEERYQSMDEVLGALTSCLVREEAHAAGALAAGSSDSHLTAFLDKLAHQDRPAVPARASTALGKHEETINKQPAAHADDTGTGITRPPRAKTKLDSPAPAATARRDEKRSSPHTSLRSRKLLIFGGVAVLALVLVGGALSLLVSQFWNGEPSIAEPSDNTVAVAETPADDAQWLDLLPLIDTQQDAVAGAWHIKDGALRLSQPIAYPRIAVPVVPDGNYRLRVKFSGTQPGEARMVLIPVGENASALAIDHADVHASGLVLKSGGPDTDVENPTRNTTFRTDAAKAQTLEVTVTRGNIDARIVATVDGQPLFTWHGLPRDLDQFGWKLTDSRQLGFGGWTAPRVIHEAKLQMLSGQAILLRRPPEGMKLPGWAATPQSELDPPSTAPQIVLRKKLSGHTQVVRALSFHPNSQQLASGGDGGQLYLWDAASGQNIGEFTGHTQSLYALAFAPDGQRLISTEGISTLKVWDLAKRSMLSSTDGWFQPIAFSPDGKVLATGGHGESKALRDPVTLAVKTPLEAYSEIGWLAFSHDNKWLAACEGGRLDLHRLPEGKRISTWQWEQLLKVAFSHDDRTLAIAGEKYPLLRLIDVTEAGLAKPERADLAVSEGVTALAWLPGSRYLVSATKGSPELQLWDTHTSKLSAKLPGHTKPINAIALSPDGRTLATAGEDFDVILWDIKTPADSLPLSLTLTAKLRTTLPDSDTMQIAVSADGKLLADRNRATAKIRLWDVATGEKKQTWHTTADSQRALAFAAPPLVFAGEGPNMVVLNTSDGSKQTPIKYHTGTLASLAFSSDGKFASVGGQGDASVQLRLGTKPAQSIGSHGNPPGAFASCVAFSADGKLLASGGNDKRVRVYDVVTAKEKFALDGGSIVHAVAFSPDGKLLASGDRYKTTPENSTGIGRVKLWDVSTGTLICEYTDFNWIVGSVAFSPDSRLLAAAQEFSNGPVRVYDLVLGGPPLVIDAAQAASVAFLPTGHTLVAGGEKTGIQIWDIDVPQVEITTATFTAPDVVNGIEPVDVSGPLATKGTGVFERMTVGGKSALVVGNGNRIYFRVDDSLMHAVPADSPDRFVLRMTVFDEFETGVGVVYHAYEPNTKGFAQGREAWRDLRGSGKWIELVYELPKARLANGDVFDADFFVITNRAPLAIHSVTLERISAKPPADFTNTLGMQFIRVPAGKSWLGGGGGKLGTREVEFLDDFYLGKYEITQGQWEEVMDGGKPSYFRPNAAGADVVKGMPDAERKQLPVENVSWDAVQEFLHKLNANAGDNEWVYRLPTADEWEYAAREGAMNIRTDSPALSGFDFYFGQPTNELLATQANMAVADLKRPCPVGQYAPNSLGLHDLFGNVREWCQDAMQHPGDGTWRRVVRGGGWNIAADVCRAARVDSTKPGDRLSNLGFRVARIAAGQWVDVIPLIDPARDKIDIPNVTGKNDWQVRGGELVCTSEKERSKLLLPVRFLGRRLEWEVEFTRTSPGGVLNFDLPAKKGVFSVCLNDKGVEGVFLGLGRFPGAFPFPKTGQRVTINLVMELLSDKEQRIECFFDGESLGQWRGDREVDGKTLATPYVAHEALSLFVTIGNFDIHRIRVRSPAGGIAARFPDQSPLPQLGIGAWQSLLNDSDLTGWRPTDPKHTGKAEAIVEDGRPLSRLMDRYGLLSTKATNNIHLR